MITTALLSIGYGNAIIGAIVIFFIIGVGTYYLIKGSAENFFVAGRSLPLFVLTMTLAAQAIDSNVLLGNVDLSYKYSFWDGTYTCDKNCVSCCVV